ncbi:extensin family protein [Lentilitoribacter sp. EG35]|uniref:extensin-like domain-containing protein n=1 Tax=Lentilitoribacter sp. EG35 TaxID=3234192 RepID=UPI003460BEAB
MSSITPLSTTPTSAPQLPPMISSLDGPTPEGQTQPEQRKEVATLFSPQAILGRAKPAESVCQRQLRRLGVRFDTPPPVVGPGSCGIASPVKVKSLSGGIDVVPDATLNCPMALAFAKWVKNELSGAARMRYLSGIKSIHQMSSYSCRTMNSKRGAKMSEHSKGNAIDIGKIKLNSGKAIVVKRPGFFAFREKGLLHKVRAQSCKYFTTVLGPGSDVHHRDHFHFDLRQRKTGYRHCDL